MRDGKIVETLPVSELNEDKLVRLMVGREVANLYPKPEIEIGDVLLRVSGISRGEKLKDCSFEVRAGEILGFAGLVGAGRTELARAVFGADRIDSGTVELEGKQLKIKKPSDAIESGVGYLTEDRKGDGLALQLGVDQNITLANLPASFGFHKPRGGATDRTPQEGRVEHQDALHPPQGAGALRRQPAEGNRRSLA